MATDLRAEQKPVPLGPLIAGPILAIIEAQSLAELESLDVIARLGLDDEGRATMLRFRYLRPIPDPDSPDLVNLTEVEVSAPVLSLISAPNLQIDEATIDLNMDVAGAEEGSAPASEALRRAMPELARLRQAAGKVNIRAAIASPRRVRPGLSIRLQLKRSPESEPLEMIRRSLADAIRVSPVETGRPPV